VAGGVELILVVMAVLLGLPPFLTWVCAMYAGVIGAVVGTRARARGNSGADR